MTFEAAQPIRKAVPDEVLGSTRSENRMETMTALLILFAPITMVASIAAALAAIVTAANG